MQGHAQSGFSLIETLVAMTVLAVSSTAILSATETHTRTVAGVSARLVAGWVAQNTLAELRQTGAAPERVQMGGAEWHVRIERKATSDPDLVRVDVAVATGAAPGAALARLTGFLDIATGGVE